jgi:hypothetical protein
LGPAGSRSRLTMNAMGSAGLACTQVLSTSSTFFWRPCLSMYSWIGVEAILEAFAATGTDLGLLREVRGPVCCKRELQDSMGIRTKREKWQGSCFGLSWRGTKTVEALFSSSDGPEPLQCILWIRIEPLQVNVIVRRRCREPHGASGSPRARECPSRLPRSMPANVPGEASGVQLADLWVAGGQTPEALQCSAHDSTALGCSHTLIHAPSPGQTQGG